MLFAVVNIFNLSMEKRVSEVVFSIKKNCFSDPLLQDSGQCLINVPLTEMITTQICFLKVSIMDQGPGWSLSYNGQVFFGFLLLLQLSQQIENKISGGEGEPTCWHFGQLAFDHGAGLFHW